MAHWVSKVRFLLPCSRISLRLAFQPSVLGGSRTFSSSLHIHVAARPLTWCCSRRQRHAASRSYFASSTTGGDDIGDDSADLNQKQTDTTTGTNSTDGDVDADADLDNSIAGNNGTKSVAGEDADLATPSDIADTVFLRKSVHGLSQSDLPQSENLTDQDRPNRDGSTHDESHLETHASDHHSYSTDDDSTGQTKPATINLSDYPRSKDGGIVIYPDVHFHNKGSTDKPDPSSLGGEGSGGTRRSGSDPSAGGNDSIFKQKEYDLRNLLYNIQKSKADKDSAAVAEKRTSMMPVEQLVQFLREHNTRDVCVIQLPPELDYVEYFLVCTAMGTRHIGRVADSLQAEVG